MSIQGQANLQFGAGGSDKATVVIGPSGVAYSVGMAVEAWVNTASSAIYSQDEMTMLVTSGSIVISIPESSKAANTFTIVGGAYNGYISGNISINWVAN